MIALLRRLFSRHSTLPDNPLEPIRLRVSPDPETTEALERRRAEMSYRPEHGFLSDKIVERA